QAMQFQPTAEASGGPVNLTWTVQDNGGTANGGSDTLTEILPITITAINDTPVRTGSLPGPQAVLENSGIASLNLSTVGYSPGDSDDALQTLSVIVTALPSTLGTVYLSDGTTVVTLGGSYTVAQLQGMQFKPTSEATGGPASLT